MDNNTYEEYKAEKGFTESAVVKDALKQVEFEIPSEKNTISIRSEWDGNYCTYPASYQVTRYNYFGGDRWVNGGDGATWKFSVEKDGWYQIGFRYQTTLTDIVAYTEIKIDGEIPFKEMEEYCFAYSDGWAGASLMDANQKPYYFYLTAGEHDISITAKVGPLRASIQSLQESMDSISKLVSMVVSITGATRGSSGGYAVDKNRDWDLDKYIMDTDNVEAVRQQAAYEIGFEKFLAKNNCEAFTDTFQNLFGMEQLPGIAAQNLMAKGIGFGPEGDYKISAFTAVLMKMAECREGATGFIEDYTYDLTPGEELELASHMLEVPASFARTQPKIQVHPLGIGGKADPARLVFDSVTGDGIQVTLIDLGDHFRIVCADIELVEVPHPMPNLPVAQIMYRHKPNFEIGTAAWCYAGGAHHSVVSTALTRDDIAMFARLTGTELVAIGDDTTKADLQKFFMK